jgi:hypothetical protein
MRKYKSYAAELKLRISLLNKIEIAVEANFPLMKSTYITQEKRSAVQCEMQCKSISGLQNWKIS